MIRDPMYRNSLADLAKPSSKLILRFFGRRDVKRRCLISLVVLVSKTHLYL